MLAAPAEVSAIDLQLEGSEPSAYRQSVFRKEIHLKAKLGSAKTED